jgi:hypothetical protein
LGHLTQENAGVLMTGDFRTISKVTDVKRVFIEDLGRFDRGALFNTIEHKINYPAVERARSFFLGGLPM